MTTSLSNVFTLSRSFFCDRLTISNLRTTNIGFDFELTEHTVDNNFEVQLTHTANNRLSALFVGMNLEGGVLFSQFAESNRHLILVCTSSGFNGLLDDWLGELDRLQNDGLLCIG